MILDYMLVILGNLRIQDILDIAIISAMIAITLIWFRDRASRFVFAGVGLIGAIYLLALYFQLYLTTAVLQGFFAIFLFFLVVIFQEDLRRLFERLALWGMLRKSAPGESASRKTADILAQAVANLARKRVGALIVINGDDILDRHLSGGAILNGQLSQALLESIFDVNSPGHDGAAVINGDQVARFGCRLPLSTHAGNYDHLGLRHTAALGLSERTDALCIVVSEERGTISLAMGENLHEMASASALGAALESFYAGRAPQKKKSYVLDWLKENPREKIIAVILACFLWFFFGYQKESIQRDFHVPIDYKNVSSEWVIEEPKITGAKVTLMGPAQAFRLFSQDQLKISLDLAQLRRGANEFPLTADKLNIPSNLTLMGIRPGNIRLRASRLILKDAQVEVVTEGRPAARYVVETIRANPPLVKVLVPEALRGEKIGIKTEQVNLQDLMASTRMIPKLILPPGAVFPEGKIPAVTVTIKMRKKKPS
ncbi:MAG: diadenylate cyclase [Smithellaceae bacterium]|nr:diadenylate cyclase [Smithellaceae bacterium]